MGYILQELLKNTLQGGFRMKAVYGTIIMLLICLGMAVPSHASLVREYQTNFGVMTLNFDGSEVKGNYTYQGGRIQGTLEGRTMPCSWQQDGKSGSCIATFSNNFKRIDLKWNYAGETGWKGDWGGTLIRQRGEEDLNASDSQVTRVYETNYGIMTLSFNGSDVKGSYTHQGGRIQGTLEGRTMPCSWQQDGKSGSCIATFSNDFKRIDLKWNYAGETGWKGNWGGKLIRQKGAGSVNAGDNHFTRVYDTNFGVMTLNFDGADVKGSYTHQGGRIQGTLEGRTMPCSWKQHGKSGSCIATFSNNFKRIDLKWNYAGETGWRGDWGGTLR
jgi:hypothetical protein